MILHTQSPPTPAIFLSASCLQSLTSSPAAPVLPSSIPFFIAALRWWFAVSAVETHPWRRLIDLSRFGSPPAAILQFTTPDNTTNNPSRTAAEQNIVTLAALLWHLEARGSRSPSLQQMGP